MFSSGLVGATASKTEREAGLFELVVLGKYHARRMAGCSIK